MIVIIDAAIIIAIIINIIFNINIIFIISIIVRIFIKCSLLFVGVKYSSSINAMITILNTKLCERLLR